MASRWCWNPMELFSLAFEMDEALESAQSQRRFAQILEAPLCVGNQSV
jgi:hypothetical protein